MSDARAWIAGLRSSTDRLRTITDSLGAEELSGPSYDEGWTIAQVLSHLGSQAEIFSAFLDAGLSGGEPPGPDAFPPIWDRWNAKTPEQQARDSVRANATLIERFESLSDEQLDTFRLSMFGMELDAAGVVRMRLSEHALHTWDVAVSLDPRAQVAPDAVELLVDTLGALAARTGKAHGQRLRVRIETTAPSRAFWLAVDDSVTLKPIDGEPPGETAVQLPAEALTRLVYGRLDPEHTPAGITTRGVQLDDLRAVFPGL